MSVTGEQTRCRGTQLQADGTKDRPVPCTITGMQEKEYQMEAPQATHGAVAEEVEHRKISRFGLFVGNDLFG